MFKVNVKRWDFIGYIYRIYISFSLFSFLIWKLIDLGHFLACREKTMQIYIYILLVCLGVCLSVRVYPINVKWLNELNRSGPNFSWNLTWWIKVYEKSNFQNLPLTKLYFRNFVNPRNLFIKSAKFLYVFVFQLIQRENAPNWNIRWARSSLKA